MATCMCLFEVLFTVYSNNKRIRPSEVQFFSVADPLCALTMCSHTTLTITCLQDFVSLLLATDTEYDLECDRMLCRLLHSVLCVFFLQFQLYEVRSIPPSVTSIESCDLTQAFDNGDNNGITPPILISFLLRAIDFLSDIVSFYSLRETKMLHFTNIKSS